MGEPDVDVKKMADETEAKLLAANRNGKKAEAAPKNSFFVWFTVLALLGVWSSVAVVWLGLVDYEGVIGKLEAYDVDGDGDFDVEDAKVLLGPAEEGLEETARAAERPPDSLAEEGPGWFYGFLAFIYDIMTPFEMQGEEDEPAAKPAAPEPKALEPGFSAKKKPPERDNALRRDVEWNLREALRQQMLVIHERVEAKKIAKMALAEVRNLMAKEKAAREALKALGHKREMAASKVKEKAKAKREKEKEKEEKRRQKKSENREMERVKESKKRAEKVRKPEKEKNKKGTRKPDEKPVKQSGAKKSLKDSEKRGKK